MHRLIALIAAFFRQWFHKRNIIIVSEHKVKHIPVGGITQFALLVLLVGSVCWASYSTGSFMAARSTLKAQNRTLRSVASARIETGFKPFLEVAAAQDDTATASVDPVIAALKDPMFTLTALDHDKMYARIAYLEHTVEELKNTNAAIIQRVNSKTAGSIEDLESIIKQTGLSADSLSKQASEDKEPQTTTDSQGGPYIPDEPGVSPDEATLYNNLDRLAILRQIVHNLPLAMPIDNAQQQSPFGRRIDPFNGHLAFHSGLDLAGPTGSRIYSTADGKITSAGIKGAYGNCIDIDHGFGITTRYGHLSQILVKEGQLVHKGDVIGIEGSTGRSTGPHLHYEVRYHDQAMNPENFLEAGQNVSQE